MTATLRLKVNAGAPVDAKPAPDVAAGAALQLVLSSTTGVDKVRWRIVAFPDGFDPSGSWLLVGSAWECYGIDGSSQISLPATGFDTYLFEAIINDGLSSGTADASLTLRGGAVVRSERGLRQLAYLETDHVDTDREWVSAVRELIAAADGGPTQGRQSHASAPLWHRFDDPDPGVGARTVLNHGTATGADLTFSGAPLWEVPGPLGESVYAANLTDTAVSAAVVDLGAEFTVWCWATAYGAGPYTFLQLVRSSDSIALVDINNDGAPTVTVIASTTATAASAWTPPVGVPALYAVSVSGGKVRLYVNGIFVGDDAITGDVTWVDETFGVALKINRGADGGPIVYHEVGAYDSALTSAEIAEMFRRGMGWRS